MNDHAELSLKAKNIIDENIVGTPIEVLCEVVYVLSKTYGINRKEIVGALLDFYENTNCVLSNREAVFKGIKYFGEKRLDFVDCLLAAYYEMDNIPIYTFDEKLEKLLAAIEKNT